MKFYMLIALMLVSTSTGWGFKIFGKKKNVDLTPSANKQVLKAEPKWYSDVKKKGLEIPKGNCNEQMRKLQQIKLDYQLLLQCLVN